MTIRIILAIIRCSLISYLFSGVALAADIRIDGFVSVIGGALLDDDEDADNGELLGYSEEDFTFKADSLYALQVRGDLDDGLSATAQIVAKGSNDFDAEFEWAFISYEINDEWRISAGKTRAPLYMYSDFLDVGYAYHWISPPWAVYDLPFNTLEGFNVEYLTDIGDWTSRLTLVAGATDGPLDIGGGPSTIRLRNAVGGAWSMNYDWLTLRGVLVTAKTSLDNASVTELTTSLDTFNVLFSAGEDEVIANLTAAGAPGGTFEALVGRMPTVDLSQYADEVLWQDDRGNYAGLALSIDLEQFIFVAEYTYVEVEDAFLADLTSYYLSAGWRLGNWLTHLTYGVNEDDAKSTTDGVIAAIPDEYVRLASSGDVDLDAGIDAGVTALNASRSDIINGVIEVVAGQAWDTKTWALGIRWDFHPSAAFKAEYTVNDLKTWHRKPKIINFGVDLVF